MRPGHDAQIRNEMSLKILAADENMFGMWSRTSLKVEGRGNPPFLVKNLEQGVEHSTELELSVPGLRQLGMIVLFWNLELEHVPNAAGYLAYVLIAR